MARVFWFESGNNYEDSFKGSYPRVGDWFDMLHLGTSTYMYDSARELIVASNYIHSHVVGFNNGVIANDNIAWRMARMTAGQPDSNYVQQGTYRILRFTFYVQTFPATGNTVRILSLGGSNGELSLPCIAFDIADTGTFALIASNGTNLSTTAAKTAGLYEIEILFQPGVASGAWQWWINGTSEGSGTTGNFSVNAPTYLSISSNNNIGSSWAFAALVYLDKVEDAAGSERLGTGVKCLHVEPVYNSTPTHTETSSGLTNTMLGAFDNVLAADPYIENQTGEAFGQIDMDGQYWINRNASYYHNAIVGVTDEGNVWTSETLITNSSTFDGATTSTVGTSTTNRILLTTLSPCWEGAKLGTPRKVEGWAYFAATSTFNWEIYYGTELLASGTTETTAFTITAPTGGWDWTKIEALSFRCWLATAGSTEVHRVYYKIYYDLDFPADVVATNVPIIAAKLITAFV